LGSSTLANVTKERIQPRRALGLHLIKNEGVFDEKILSIPLTFFLALLLLTNVPVAPAAEGVSPGSPRGEFEERRGAVAEMM
jgi:hypothetical protein